MSLSFGPAAISARNGAISSPLHFVCAKKRVEKRAAGSTGKDDAGKYLTTSTPIRD
jgi:hypothetical protein